MINQEQMRQFNSLLENAQTILIMYGSNPSNDELAAAAALFDALKKTGKQVSIYAPKVPQKSMLGFNQEVVGETKTEVGRQNLVVSFDYSEEAVDKVSYHIGEESNRFYLTIKPKQGQEPLNTESVEFSYTGADADLIFIIGVSQLEKLEQLYYGYESLYRDTPVVTFHNFPPSFATQNLGADNASISEAVASTLKELQLSISPDSATGLLSGIEDATNGLRDLSVTADTFEIAAHLLRSGAERQQIFDKSVKNQQQPTKEKTPTVNQNQQKRKGEFSVQQSKSDEHKPSVSRK